MNGRIYDPLIARFLSADPFVQEPDNSQNLNRYSYCLNNPLAITDPSGFDFWSMLKDAIHTPTGRICVGILVGIVSRPLGMMVSCTLGTLTTMLMGTFEGINFNQILFESAVTAGVLLAANTLNWLNNYPGADNQAYDEIAKDVAKKAATLGCSAGGEAENSPAVDQGGNAVTTEGNNFYDKTYNEGMEEPYLLGMHFRYPQMK